MFDRLFRLSENNTNVRTELLAGLTTFLTMAYIIVVQPMVLSGRMSPHADGHGLRGRDHGHVHRGRAGLGDHGPVRPLPHRTGPRHGGKLLLRRHDAPAGREDDRRPGRRRPDRRRLDHPLADRPGRGVLLGRALPAALHAGRAREAHGGHQPQHAQRHRHRHRAVHRADRHGQHAPAAERPVHAAGN